MSQFKLKPIRFVRFITIAILSIAIFTIISNYKIINNNVIAQECVAVPQITYAGSTTASTDQGKPKVLDTGISSSNGFCALTHDYKRGLGVKKWAECVLWRNANSGTWLLRANADSSGKSRAICTASCITW